MPYYQDKYISIYNADARYMSFIPDKSVHLIITSPPYNVGMNYDEHNDRLTNTDYLSLMENALKECYRVLVKGGRIAVNAPSCCKQSTGSKYAYIAVKLHNIMEDIGFNPREWVAWIKTPKLSIEDYDKTYRHQGWGKSTSWGSWKSPSNPYVRDISEYIIVMEKEQPNLEGDKAKIDITKDEFMRYTNNAWFILPTTQSKSHHPAAFPPELPYRLIKLYSYQGNIVLDPFCGSGTVLQVAKALKRKAIGVDVSEKYCKITKDKCRQEYLF